MSISMDVGEAIAEWLIENGYAQPWDLPDVWVHADGHAISGRHILACPAGDCALVIAGKELMILRCGIVTWHGGIKLEAVPLGIVDLNDPTALDDIVAIITRPTEATRCIEYRPGL